MTMTDPIADMLTRLRNANMAMHDTVKMPSSKLKESLAVVLEKEGYISSWEVKPPPKGPGDQLEITLKYDGDRKRTIWWACAGSPSPGSVSTPWLTGYRVSSVASVWRSCRRATDS